MVIKYHDESSNDPFIKMFVTNLMLNLPGNSWATLIAYPGLKLINRRRVNSLLVLQSVVSNSKKSALL